MPRILSGRVILYLLVLLVLDLSLAPFFRIGFLKPSLGYLLILYATFQWGVQKTVPMALAVGISRDLVNSQWVGIETLACGMTAFGLEIVIQKIERKALLFRLMISFVFILLIELFNLLLSNSLTEDSNLFWGGLGGILGTTVYSCALLPVFFYCTAWWFRDQLLIKQYELFR